MRIKIFTIMVLMVLMAFMAIPVVMAQTAPPCTVVGVVTLNSTPVDDAIITCNGTTTSTHDGGLYTIDVQPGDNIIYATFTNSTRTYTGDTGLFYVSSGDYVSADIELSLYTPTPTPGFGSGDGSNFNLLNGYSMGFIILYCVIFLVCIVFNKMVFPHYPYMLSGLFMIGQFVLMALMASAYMDQGSAIVMIIVFLIAVLKFSYDMQARGMG